MCRIFFWPDDTEPKKGDIVVIESEFREFLHELLGQIPSDQITIYLSSPVVTANREIILLFVSASNGPITYDPLEAPAIVQLFLRYWRDFCTSTLKFDVQRAAIASERLIMLKLSSCYLWRVRELVSLILRLCTLLKQLLEEPTVLKGISPSTYRTDWWLLNATFIDDIKCIQAEIALTDFGNAPILRRELQAVARLFEGALKEYCKNTSSSFLALSKLSLWSSLYWLEKNVPTLALLLCHRCVEFFLTSEAWDYGVIYFDGERPRFTSERGLNYQRDIGLSRLEKELVQHGHWMRDRSRTDYLNTLNKLRNQVIFTHGAFRVSAAGAKLSIQKAKSLLKDSGYFSNLELSGPQEIWQKCLPERSVFDFERDFQAFVERIA